MSLKIFVLMMVAGLALAKHVEWDQAMNDDGEMPDIYDTEPLRIIEGPNVADDANLALLAERDSEALQDSTDEEAMNAMNDNNYPGDEGPMPDAYMGVRIIEGPNTTDDESLAKIGDVPVMDPNELALNDEVAGMVMDDTNAEPSTPLVQNDDPDSIKNKGSCHWGIEVWRKPGESLRCSCLKCLCETGGTWNCSYEFSYCPYYYCGNVLYNPATKICCCGNVHDKKGNHACCGHAYYDRRASQCCNYYSVKPRSAKCPRYQV